MGSSINFCRACARWSRYVTPKCHRNPVITTSPCIKKPLCSTGIGIAGYQLGGRNCCIVSGHFHRQWFQPRRSQEGGSAGGFPSNPPFATITDPPTTTTTAPTSHPAPAPIKECNITILDSHLTYSARKTFLSGFTPLTSPTSPLP